MELQKPPQLHCEVPSLSGKRTIVKHAGQAALAQATTGPLSPKDYKGHPTNIPAWLQAMTFRKLSPPWPHLIVYNWHPSHPWVLLGDTLRLTGTSEASRPLIQPYLRHVDTAFQKGTVGRIVGANVAVFAPVAGEGAIDTCQAAAGGKWDS